MKTTEKRILDYGLNADVVELNSGNLRIDVNDEQIKRLKRFIEETEIEEPNELDVFPEIFDEFDYLEFIPDLGCDLRFGALTSSCAIYDRESERLWWYPDYQIHNIFEQLLENKQVVFTLAENDNDKAVS